MMLIRKAAILVMFSALGAHADIYDDCDAAIKAGDKAAALLNGKIMLNRQPVPYLELGRITKCLSFATGEKHDYSPKFGRVMPVAEIRKAEIEAEKTAQEEAKKERERQEAEKLARARTFQRELAVLTQLTESCQRLYRQAPDETITNKLCFDIFMNIGLPD
ncbi:hypothetical protein [Pseudosulfitobacter pseudonitzschiae]|uniref:hypothetical protein n=2 Tax=Pseudosulfitobacter pseudonitzschiae TaxID=1402135 RepID=UPI001AF29F5C|nr:hypothetical protein [Pseudosulfitobacter pseudonitzschiae]MBM1816228.1 hypothetical protein [Pseudosulfitobacter pseudonitzschiae]MBM1833719.1 hypothetical protein [Pseudosulfitobacter pseudonitzschiae]MBM1838585.1 hypothetical protein [Pseudosulfitobacter pseudonitzschiae]MBM1842933.1 hypothetical protein [Pseudosulfitobacter pseudonitzschiae]MBM1857481.1 hypothetical protein [Pseudosulfitobacter pseudonitzschiae]